MMSEKNVNIHIHVNVSAYKSAPSGIEISSRVSQPISDLSTSV